MKISDIIKSDTPLAQIMRFGITGGIATVVQYVVYLLMLSLCGLSPEVSAMVSYVISFVGNYILSNYFTFHTKPQTQNAVRFGLCHLINLGLQTGLVALFAPMVGNNYALMPAMAICIPINFILVRKALLRE